MASENFTYTANERRAPYNPKVVDFHNYCCVKHNRFINKQRSYCVMVPPINMVGLHLTIIELAMWLCVWKSAPRTADFTVTKIAGYVRAFS